MPVMFTDKNARTFLVLTQNREALQGGEASDEVLLALLSKLDPSEFVRAPAKVNLSETEFANACDKVGFDGIIDD